DDAVGGEQVAGARRLVRGAGDRLTPLFPAAQVLGRAVIGLQPGKGEVGQVGDAAGEVERRLAGLDAAAVAAHVDLDIDRQRRPGLPGGLLETGELRRVVG